MSRRERAIKKQYRLLENGRSSFKSVYIDGCKGFGSMDNEGLKQMQKELKECRKRTREYSCQIRNKEAIEV